MVRAINTDAQALAKSPVKNTLAIGQSVTRGLGAGGVPDVGRKAAEESKEMIAKAVEGADLVSQTCYVHDGDKICMALFVHIH